MEFQYKNVLIWGYGISGRSVEKVLIDLGVDYTVLDEGNKVTGGGFIGKLTKKIISRFDLIVLSPGINYHRKEIEWANKLGIDVISEIEFGYMFLNPKSKVIAVSGTNGKTTTVNLIYNLLKTAGKKVCEVGNIGKPFSEIYKKNYDYVVLELSSFQLEELKHFRADISILLNIAPDHIDRHGSFENYIKAKLNIFKNQQKNDYAIINEDDEIIRNCKGVSAKKITYSLQSNKYKYWLNNGCIYKNKKALLDLNEFNISPVFYQDVMCTLIVSEILDFEAVYIRNMLSDYMFLSHRCEFVTKSNNIEYYNDSKATNIHAVEHCLQCMPNGKSILLLLGGLNKDLDFKDFVTNMPDSVVRVVAFGKARRKIYKAKKYNKNICFAMEKSLHNVMANIDDYLDGIDTVLLSPACASFDEFKSYEDRGDYFKKKVLLKRDRDEKAKVKEG